MAGTVTLVGLGRPTRTWFNELNLSTHTAEGEQSEAELGDCK